MNRLVAAMVVVLVAAGAVPAAATLGASPTDDASSQPGAAFAGVVGVQQAEVGNEMASRAFAQRMNASNSSDGKAAVVADESARIEQRLSELEQRKQALERARENGSISQAQYQARLAAIAAQVRALEHRANRTAEVAKDLPDAALREHGVNVSHLRDMAHRASELGGGAVAEAARKVAGEGVGNGLEKRPPQAGDRGQGKDRGQAGDRGNRSAGDGQGNAGESGQAGSGNATTDHPGAGGSGSSGQDGAGGDGGGAGGAGQAGTATETATETSD